MADYPQVDVSLLLLNRIVSYIDEGIDLGLRIAHLPDSSLQAILVGQVQQMAEEMREQAEKQRRERELREQPVDAERGAVRRGDVEVAVKAVGVGKVMAQETRQAV